MLMPVLKLLAAVMPCLWHAAVLGGVMLLFHIQVAVTYSVTSWLSWISVLAAFNLCM
jgi:hypothetical protein